MILSLQNCVVSEKLGETVSQSVSIVIINDVSGIFESGKLNVIMGPTHCGKSKIIKYLYGLTEYSTSTGGKILLDGEVRKPESWFYRTVLISQTPHLLNQKMVKQIFNMVADLNPKKPEPVVGLDDFESIISRLHLEKLLNTETKTLSLDERYRVAIACSLIAGKEILLLDAPTAALDPDMAVEVMRYLKELAVDRGKMIVLTSDRCPEGVFNLFDYVVFLENGSSRFYNGPVAQISDFFDSNQISKPENLTLVDFIFDVFYSNSTDETMAPQKEIIKKIRKEDVKKNDEVFNNTKLSCRAFKYKPDFPSAEKILGLAKHELVNIIQEPKTYIYTGILAAVNVALIALVMIVSWITDKENKLHSLMHNIHVTYLITDPLILIRSLSAVFLLIDVNNIHERMKKDLYYNNYTRLSFFISRYLQQVILHLLAALFTVVGLLPMRIFFIYSWYEIFNELLAVVTLPVMGMVILAIVLKGNSDVSSTRCETYIVGGIVTGITIGLSFLGTIVTDSDPKETLMEVMAGLLLFEFANPIRWSWKFLVQLKVYDLVKELENMESDPIISNAMTKEDSKSMHECILSSWRFLRTPLDVMSGYSSWLHEPQTLLLWGTLICTVVVFLVSTYYFITDYNLILCL